MDGLKVMNYKLMKDIFKIYENEVRKNTKNKKKIYSFEKHKMMYINDIYNTIYNYKTSGDYTCKYNIFLITRPKCRIVMSLNIKDKVINHYVTRHYLIPKLEKYLDFRNVATRSGMGTSYARVLINKYLEKNKKYNNFYILKMDISKYFYTIDHNILKSLLKGKLSNKEYNFICDILNSTNYSYINKSIGFFRNRSDIPFDKLPFYEQNKGLPIGNMTSQFLSIFYLYKLDHKIVHDYKVKYYVRYMDDFILIDKDKEKLKKIFLLVKNELEKTYNLKLNLNKCHITNCKEGFVFLGYKYKIINTKTIITLEQSSKKRILKIIKEVNYLYNTGKITFESYFSSINNYLHSNKLSSRWWIKRNIYKEIDKYYEFNK